MLPADKLGARLYHVAMMGAESEVDAERYRQERDLYRKLLDLGDRVDLDGFLGEMLALIAGISQARRGYFELLDERTGAQLWKVHGCAPDEVPTFRAGMSQGVIAEAVTSRATIVCDSALHDVRFSGRGSVQRHQIKAVLCAPILVGSYSGVIYLQDRTRPGVFTEEDRERAEVFARHIVALAERLLLRQRLLSAPDPTQTYRRQLRADGLVGAGEAMARVLHDVLMAARVDVGVLLTGTTGTGKTMLARVLHDSGPRASGPFVALNCAALPEGLLESELFGALPGAHSTATRRIEGKVAAAERGTLFLDEVGELSLGTQAKLLQLLQERQYFPLGGSQVVRADIRLVAATNVDLKAAVAQRTFREDLFWRLNVLTIRVPSVSERAEDIPDLLLEACARAARAFNLPHLPLSFTAINSAQTAEWPGNVRQIQHAAETALIRACNESAQQIEARHLFPERGGGDEPTSYQDLTRRFQAQIVRRVLDECDGNVSEAARKLELTRPYLYKLMSSFGIVRPRG